MGWPLYLSKRQFGPIVAKYCARPCSTFPGNFRYQLARQSSQFPPIPQTVEQQWELGYGTQRDEVYGVGHSAIGRTELHSGGTKDARQPTGDLSEYRRTRSEAGWTAL